MGAPSGLEGPPRAVTGALGWVDVAARAITTVGFPVVVACALLWFLLTRFQATVEVISTRMEATGRIAQALVDVQAREVDELERQTVELQQQTATLRGISDKLERGLGQHSRPGPN